MTALRLFLFGSPRIEHGGQILPMRRSKALALLAYLAVARRPQHRDTLVTLVWPEFDPDSARNNLRRELSLLKTMLGDKVLVADRMQIALDPDADLSLDVSAFQEQVVLVRQHDHQPSDLCPRCAEALANAARLYTDDFMAGFSLPDSAAFDEWQFFQREELRQQLAWVLQALVVHHRELGAYNTALEYARRWLTLDPLHEQAHRGLMQLYSWSGQHSAAIRQYEECARLLEAELGADPEAATMELFEAIKARQLPRPAPNKNAAQQHEVGPDPSLHTVAMQTGQASDSPRHNLPPQPGPFLGRSQELDQIGKALMDPACRLLTVVGPGGIGKTRLAVQAATAMLGHFRNGVRFVALQSLSSSTSLIQAIADALHVHITDQHEALAQLLNHLRDKELLLVLDNFEHLLDGAAILSKLLLGAPGVKILTTSREGLNVVEEWLHPLAGMPYPAGNRVDDAGTYSAVELFFSIARRIRPDLAYDDEREGVVRVCQLVEGVPLAIELAASWVKTMSCAQIAAEIQRNLDFLTTRLRDVAPKHRSMRAVFEQSWARLSAEEQTVFKRLAVFRGGFAREAAAHVAGTSLATLGVLVDKSLVRREPNGRYQVHELLRQYASEQLQRLPDEKEHTRQLHSAYYTHYLAQRVEDIRGGRQLDVLAEIEAELENIREAWQWAAECVEVEALQRSLETLVVFCDMRSRYLEAVSACELALRRLNDVASGREIDQTRAMLLVQLGGLHVRLGRLEEAEAALNESQALFQTLEMLPPPGYCTDPVFVRGIVASIRGDYGEAARLGEQALAHCIDETYLVNRQMACYLLARAALLQGRVELAHHHVQQAYVLTQRNRDRWFMAYCLNELGNLEHMLGNYDAARMHYMSSYQIRKDFQDPEGMAAALNHLGQIAIFQGEIPEAERVFQEAVSISREINNLGIEAAALHGLGRVALAREAHPAAVRYFRQALAVAREGQFVALILSMFVDIAELMAQMGQGERAAKLLVFACHHPGSEPETKERARNGASRLHVQKQPTVLSTAGDDHKAWDRLDALAMNVQTALAVSPRVASSELRAARRGATRDDHYVTQNLSLVFSNPTALVERVPGLPAA